MPCGGVFPVGPWQNDPLCFYCGKPLGEAEQLWVEEFDGGIHLRCLRGFLGTPEGEIIRLHQHPVVTEMHGAQYVRLLAYSPELSQSDWALCSVAADGEEEVISSWSRMEYEQKE